RSHGFPLFPYTTLFRSGGALTLRQQGLLEAGYVLVYVTHSGSPKYTVREIVADVHRAVRFVRYHAEKLEIDPDRLGIMGASSGGDRKSTRLNSSHLVIS